MTKEQKLERIKRNKHIYGLSQKYIDSLKIPKLLSRCIGQHSTMKQIMDDKNNFSIVEKIDQLKNLVKCLERKYEIIEKVENKRKIQKRMYYLYLNLTNCSF